MPRRGESEYSFPVRRTVTSARPVGRQIPFREWEDLVLLPVHDFRITSPNLLPLDGRGWVGVIGRDRDHRAPSLALPTRGRESGTAEVDAALNGSTKNRKVQASRRLYAGRCSAGINPAARFTVSCGFI